MKRQAPLFAVVSGLLSLAFGCAPPSEAKSGRSSATTTVESNDGSSADHGTGPVAEARKVLLETARRMDGDFVEVVADIVDAVESGDQPWSVADKRMYEFRPGHHQFASETIAAYEKWKAARISVERE